MKKLSLIVIVLCTCITFCNQEDTKSERVWRRTFEARLSNAEWRPCRTKPPARDRVVEEIQCGADEQSAPAADEACDEIADHAHALRVLSFQPRCIDAAIEALERFGVSDAAAMNDVAVAYSVRAQLQDRPSDFLRALDAAEQAVLAAPKLPAARFNRALLQETLGLSERAIVSWNELLESERSDWTDEARRHRDRLIQGRTSNDAARWTRNRAALPAALRVLDRRTVAQLIAPFPSAAQQYLDEELLPQWAANPTRQQLDEITLFAEELSQALAHDPFSTDVVAAIAGASRAPDRLVALQQGHRAFEEGRLAEQSMQWIHAGASYQKASALLARGGSPFHLRATLGHASTTFFRDPKRALSLLDPIAKRAAEHGYRHLRARIEWARAHVLASSSYMESLAAYEEAMSESVKGRDFESLTAVHARRAGVLGAVGHRELAWREAFYAQTHVARLIDIKDRHALCLEAAASALALGHPQTALLFHDACVGMLQRELLNTAPEDLHRYRRIQQLLSIAYAHRAPLQLQLHHDHLAIRDRHNADRLKIQVDNPDPDTQRIRKASDLEWRGQSLSIAKPSAAIDAFTRAMELTSLDKDRASLLTQRARAKLRAGRGKDAQRDLNDAISLLDREGSKLLAKRQVGQDEELWSAYFSRFQETHRLLIRLLIEQGSPEMAFAYAERARAAEPLDLVLQHVSASPELRVIAAERPSDDLSARAWLKKVQSLIPPGTFITQYCVLDELTYAWVLSRDRFAPLTLSSVQGVKSVRWSANLQNAVQRRNTNAVDRVLKTAFAELAAEPMAAIATMPGGHEPKRLVFVPDGGIHGLPFPALRNPTTGQYLIQRAPIEIGGSTTLYLLSLERDAALKFSRHPSVLAVGDPAFRKSLSLAQGMKRLPFAQYEANEIAGIYAPYSNSLTGAGATIPAFFALAARHDVVHLAAHAIVNPVFPTRSFLLMAPSTGHSGALDAEELLKGLKLDRARLVILSACSSAGGLPVGPEGVAPFVRPILAAGVPAVIGSLWDVDDNATTADLMVSFHRHYEEGSDAAKAMQSAQLDLLSKNNNKPDPRSVLAWASFQVIGHASSPFPAHALSNGGNPLGIHTSNSLQRPDRLRPQ